MVRAPVRGRWWIAGLAALAGLVWIGIARVVERGAGPASQPLSELAPPSVSTWERPDDHGPAEVGVEALAGSSIRTSDGARGAFLEVRVVNAVGEAVPGVELILSAPGALASRGGSLTLDGSELLEHIGTLGYGGTGWGLRFTSDPSASTRRTDAEGVVRFEDYEVPEGATALRLRVLRSRAPGLMYSLALPPPPVLTVELPPVGTLEVEVFDPSGSTDLGHHRVRLSSSHGADWPMFTVEGVARFGGLSADAQYELVVERHDAACSKPVQVSGPAVHGATVRVRIPVEFHPRILARAVDEEGRALSGVLRSESFPPGKSTSGVVTHLASTTRLEGGRFEFELRTLDAARELFLRLDSESGPRREARIALPPLGLGAELPLGDILIEALPLAVAGKVIDAGGAPLTEAHVRVVELSPAGRPRALGVEFAVRADGSFELYHRVANLATLTVQARAPGFGSTSASRVQPGRADLLLHLSPR